MGRKTDLLIHLGMHRLAEKAFTKEEISVEQAKAKKMTVAELEAYVKDVKYGTNTRKDPKLEKLSKIYEDLKEHFVGEFHDVLWQVIVARDNEFIHCCFTVVVRQEGNAIGIATRGLKGYIPTMAYFNEKRYDKAQLILDKLNEAVFSMDKRAAIELTCTTL